jgi:5-methyltetrahydropteroyltriglutamate--homocysteine methyltransferase
VKRSTARILTTHVGSLPDLPNLVPGQSNYDSELKVGVETLIRKQQAVGLDSINEGEWTKGGDWLGYLESRIGGFEPRPGGPLVVTSGKDREVFADYYAFAAERGPSTPISPTGPARGRRVNLACTQPITYIGGDTLAREIGVFQAALAETDAAEEPFLTTTAPASIEPYRHNEFYPTEEAFLYAMADALAVEYHAIADAGFLVQVDDAWTAALWDRIGIEMGLEAFRKRCALRVEVLNHALRGIPQEKVRYHLCWGSWHGPHAFDVPVRDIVDLLLGVNAGAYLIEAANARHEHEYLVWDDVRLPEGKILVPGVVTHHTDTVEHPDLVALRIARFAERVGKESVIAGADCGFGGRSHPQVGWAKLRALVEGAQRATERLTG